MIMYISLHFLLFVLLSTNPCLGYEEEALKLKAKDGILRLFRDFQNERLDNDLLEYLPDEFKELLNLVERYFMGKHEGYSRSKVFYDK